MNLFVLLTLLFIMTATHADDDIDEDDGSSVPKLLATMMGLKKMKDIKELTFTAGKMTTGFKPRPQLTCRPDPCHERESVTCYFPNKQFILDSKTVETKNSGWQCDVSLAYDLFDPKSGSSSDSINYSFNRQIDSAYFKCTVVVLNKESFVDPETCSIDYHSVPYRRSADGIDWNDDRRSPVWLIVAVVCLVFVVFVRVKGYPSSRAVVANPSLIPNEEPVGRITRQRAIPTPCGLKN